MGARKLRNKSKGVRQERWLSAFFIQRLIRHNDKTVKEKNRCFCSTSYHLTQRFDTHLTLDAFWWQPFEPHSFPQPSPSKKPSECGLVAGAVEWVALSMLLPFSLPCKVVMGIKRLPWASRRKRDMQLYQIKEGLTDRTEATTTELLNWRKSEQMKGVWAVWQHLANSASAAEAPKHFETSLLHSL